MCIENFTPELTKQKDNLMRNYTECYLITGNIILND